MSVWHHTTLDALCRFVGGQGFPPEYQGRSEGDVPFIKVSDMELPGNARRIVGANNWLTDETVVAKRFKPQPRGAIVFAKIGEAIKRERVRVLTRPTLIDNNMMAAVPRDTVDPEFLFNLLRFIPFSKDHGGTSLPYLRQSDLSKIGAYVPPLAEQERIAGVLGAFDDLIEMNRRLAANLESLIHTLFALEGFDTVPSAGNAAPLADLLRINPKIAKPKGSAAYVDMSALPTASALLDPPAHRPVAGGARFQNGDTLLARITPCLENGKTAYVTNLEDDATAVGSTEFIVLRGEGQLDGIWPYALARSTRFRAFAIQQLGDGTSGRQRLSASAVGSYLVPCPSDDALRRFRERTMPLVEAMVELHGEAYDLARQRDELLPLLMSGKVRVRDLEAVA